MAEVELSPRLAKFTERAARLNAASDSLNSALTKIEKRLVDANIGVEVWLRRVLTSTDKKGSTGEEKWIGDRLGFAKIDGTWCIATKKTEFVSGFFEGDTNCPYENEYVVGDPMPLSKASREIRIAALEHIPDLIEVLSEEADRCLSAIAEAQKLAV